MALKASCARSSGVQSPVFLTKINADMLAARHGAAFITGWRNMGMSKGEMLYLAFVCAAFGIFGLVLAFEAARCKKTWDN